MVTKDSDRNECCRHCWLDLCEDVKGQKERPLVGFYAHNTLESSSASAKQNWRQEAIRSFPTKEGERFPFPVGDRDDPAFSPTKLQLSLPTRKKCTTTYPMWAVVRTRMPIRPLGQTSHLNKLSKEEVFSMAWTWTADGISISSSHNAKLDNNWQWSELSNKTHIGNWSIPLQPPITNLHSIS